MDITTSFDNTNARAYYLLAEKILKKKIRVVELPFLGHQ